MKTKKDFIELVPGIKIFKSNSEVEGCELPVPCLTECNTVANGCMTGGTSDCTWLHTDLATQFWNEWVTARTLCIA